MVPRTRMLLHHLIKHKQQNANDTHFLFKGSLGFPVKFSPWHMANRLVASFVRVWAGHLTSSLLVPLQTLVWLTRQNMALDLSHLQASAYHTDSDNLSEYGEAMLNLAYIFPVSFYYYYYHQSSLLLFLTMKNQLSSLPSLTNLPSFPPLPSPTHKNPHSDSLVKTIEIHTGHAQLQHLVNDHLLY